MKVLLASDGSKCSEEAAWLLSRLPHRDQLDLTVLSVLAQPIAAFYSPAKPYMDQMAEDDRKFIEEQQAKIREMFSGANAKLDCKIVEGRAQEVIVDYADDINADMVVVGAKGHSQIDRILLGSTSDYVATHAHCSVLVVRPTGLREESARDLKVAIAYDTSGAAHAALEEFLEFDWKTHTDITLCAVAGYSPVFNPEYGFNPESLQDEARRALNQGKDFINQKVDSVHTEVIEYDHVAEGLVRYTEQHKCDLIVIGDTGRSTLARTLLGSVSRFVLRHATCGVWITRNRSVEGLKKKASVEGDQVAKTS